MDYKRDNKFKTILITILFAWLIYMIITAFTFDKKPVKKESRESHPIAYMVDGDSVRVYFVWQDSVVNKVYSADTSVMYHKDNKPDFKTNVNIILK